MKKLDEEVNGLSEFLKTIAEADKTLFKNVELSTSDANFLRSFNNRISPSLDGREVYFTESCVNFDKEFLDNWKDILSEDNLEALSIHSPAFLRVT